MGWSGCVTVEILPFMNKREKVSSCWQKEHFSHLLPSWKDTNVLKI